MSFSGKIKVSMTLLMALSSLTFAAKSTSGKIVDKLGEAKIQKAAKIGTWDEANVGGRVREKDQIRTGIESHVAIALSDGSSIVVQENSFVEFTTLQAENGVQTALTDVKTGRVKFDAQKQHSNGSFKFKTATATAAIRGTRGYFGWTLKARGTYLSLGSGNAILKSNDGGECEVKAGQTGFFRGNSPKCIVFNAKSSGNKNFLNELDALIDNETITEDQLKDLIQKLDVNIQAQINKALETMSCKFEDLEDTITVNRTTIKGTCAAGLKVVMAGTSIESNGAPFEIQTDWSSTAFGQKNFNATCTGSLEFPCPQGDNKNKATTCKKDISLECGTLTTYYKNPADTTVKDTTVQDSTKADSTVVAKPFAVTTPSPVTVCEPGSVTIEGTFDQTDPKATLFVKMGKYKSRNLVPLSVNGEFSHMINISDIAGNWNEFKVNVEYNGASGKHKATILLNVNKACKQVNMKRPVLTFGSSSAIRCDARFSLTEATDDIVIVTKEIDGNAYGETTYRQNTNLAVKLTPGIHKYTLKATDQAGNTARISKSLGCFPSHTAAIEVSGKPYEFINLPPAPPQTQSNEISKTLRFRIVGVLQQNPEHIKRITVTQDGNTILNKSGDQITDLDYNEQVKLSRGTKSKIIIYVEMMNGKKYYANKTYEVN